MYKPNILPVPTPCLLGRLAGCAAAPHNHYPVLCATAVAQSTTTFPILKFIGLPPKDSLCHPPPLTRSAFPWLACSFQLPNDVHSYIYLCTCHHQPINALLVIGFYYYCSNPLHFVAPNSSRRRLSWPIVRNPTMCNRILCPSLPRRRLPNSMCFRWRSKVQSLVVSVVVTKPKRTMTRVNVLLIIPVSDWNWTDSITHPPQTQPQKFFIVAQFQGMQWPCILSIRYFVRAQSSSMLLMMV